MHHSRVCLRIPSVFNLIVNNVNMRSEDIEQIELWIDSVANHWSSPYFATIFALAFMWGVIGLVFKFYTIKYST